LKNRHPLHSKNGIDRDEKLKNLHSLHSKNGIDRDEKVKNLSPPLPPKKPLHSKNGIDRDEKSKNLPPSSQNLQNILKTAFVEGDGRGWFSLKTALIGMRN
jgi:hypothetical protein